MRKKKGSRKGWGLYVWSIATSDDPRMIDILRGDYKNGQFGVFAQNEPQAWELLKRKNIVYWWYLQDRPTALLNEAPPPGMKLSTWILGDISPYIRGHAPGAIRPTRIRYPYAFGNAPQNGDCDLD